MSLGFNLGQTGNASQVGAGIVKLATQAQINNGDADDGGVPLAVNPAQLAEKVAALQSIDITYIASGPIAVGRGVRIGPTTDQGLSYYYTSPDAGLSITYSASADTPMFRQSFTIDTTSPLRKNVRSIVTDWSGSGSGSTAAWRGYYEYTIYEAGPGGTVGAVVVPTAQTGTGYWSQILSSEIPLTGLPDGDYVLEIKGVLVSTGGASQDRPVVWYKQTAAVPPEPWNEFLISNDNGATFAPIIAGNSVGEYRVNYDTNPTVVQGTSADTETSTELFFGVSKTAAADAEPVVIAVVGVVDVEQDVVPGTNYIFNADGLLATQDDRGSVKGITGKTVLITQAGSYNL